MKPWLVSSVSGVRTLYSENQAAIESRSDLHWNQLKTYTKASDFFKIKEHLETHVISNDSVRGRSRSFQI